MKVKDITVFVPNDPFEEDSQKDENLKSHLDMVRSMMKRLGSPVIFGLYGNEQNVFFALEGSHRIAICSQDKIKPILYCLNKKDMYYSDYANSNFLCLQGEEAEWVRHEHTLMNVKETLERMYEGGHEVTSHHIHEAKLRNYKCKMKK